MPSFQASAGFSGKQGQNNWRYQYRLLDAAEFQDLLAYSGGSWWRKNQSWDWGNISGSGITPGSSADTSRTFSAPESGTLTISAGLITFNPKSYGSARVKLMKNETQLWPQTEEWQSISASGTVRFPELTTTIGRGDRLYFIANAGADRSNGQDDIGWNPAVTYTKIVDSVAVSSVYLDKRSLSPGIGETVTVQAYVAPFDAANKRLHWGTTNSQVATVSNGRITVNGPGTAMITVTTADGGLTDQAKVTVDGAGPITREELVFLLEQALKLPLDLNDGMTGGTPPVPPGFPARQSFSLPDGDSGSLLGDSLSEPVTKEEAAAIFIQGYNQAMEQDAVRGDISGIADRNEISGWALPYVEADSRLGIVEPGLPYPAQFEPQAPVTRLEALDMVKRLLASMDIQGMIASAITGKKSKLVIPPNTYRVGPKSGSTILNIANASNLEIVADGVTVIATKLTRALSVSNSSNVTISGMTINYDPLPFTQGRIKAIAADRSYLDIKLDEGYPRKLFSRLTIYDPATRFQKRGINHLWGTTASWNADGTMRITLKGVGTNASVGDPVTMAGGPEDGGIPHAITADGSKGIVFKNITLHTAPGFGFLEAGGEGGTVLNGFKLIPGPAPKGATEKPLLTAIWDGIQFKTARKGPIVENSVIQSAGDDSFSIQSGDYGVVKVQGDEIIIVLRDGSQAPRAGERLKQFNSSPEAIIVSQQKVSKASAGIDAALLQKISAAGQWTPWRFTEETYYKIKLDRPSPFKQESFIFSPDRMGNGFIFRNNKIYSPGRGMLLKAGDGLIENNEFRGGDKAIVVSPEGVTDTHAGAGSNLIIRNNRVIGTGYHHYMPWSDQAGAISFSSGNIKSVKAFDNIQIENNVFDSVNGLNLNLSSVNNAVVTGNKFLNTHLTAPNNNGAEKNIDAKSVIWVKNSTNITFSGNEIDRMGPYSKTAVNVQQPSSGITGASTGVRIVNSK
ncbi:Ig-like domain-containing protein [Paenibacillus pasadenensis]|uniref:Ig-like domain-containing protein n=1 Tax=Paenibacillus pasadenensis TaxID=217090 RepID=UPI00203DCBD4|nr:Ig-like domain-containing protein [Paenibacillus pasadenensis]MCM3749928.1 Ig-like domain-containing protein [Paenibacillus pasadenensis]